MHLFLSFHREGKPWIEKVNHLCKVWETLNFRVLLSSCEICISELSTIPKLSWPKDGIFFLFCGMKWNKHVDKWHILNGYLSFPGERKEDVEHGCKTWCGPIGQTADMATPSSPAITRWCLAGFQPAEIVSSLLWWNWFLFLRRIPCGREAGSISQSNCLKCPRLRPFPKVKH